MTIVKGQDIRLKVDLSRFVKWPEYVRLQRQKIILHQRLKVPPAIAQFSRTLDKNTGTQLFKPLYVPPRVEAGEETRLDKSATAAVEGQDKDVI